MKVTNRRFRLKKVNKLLELADSLPNYQSSLFESTRHLLLFIGYPRSGHTLVSALIDAHPNALVANHLDILWLLHEGYSKKDIRKLIFANSISEADKERETTGYKYKVSNQWQGKHQTIKIIGDKRGAGTSLKLARAGNLDLLDKLASQQHLPLKLVHVVRNPYDMLSSMVKRWLEKKKNATSSEQVVFTEKMNNLLQQAEICSQLMQNKAYSLHTVYLENLISHPAETLSQLFTFLELPLGPAFIDDCTSLIWDKPRSSQLESTLWSSKNIKEVAQAFSHFPQFERYF